MLLNNRFVVPVNLPIDNVTTFGSLSAALTTPGLSAGDVIEIQADPTPGNVTSGDLPESNRPRHPRRPGVSLDPYTAIYRQ
jgi:hypothetical protein